MSEPVRFHSVIEIYITHECNLTCSNCNRYNNYDFSGHMDWRVSEVALLEWGKRITADIVTIIGGEPALHPELEAWIDLVKRAWPNVPAMVQTNGTIAMSCKPRVIEKYNDGIGFVASLHRHGMEKAIRKNVGAIIDNTEFGPCALIDKGTSFLLHDNVPESSFRSCGMKFSHTILDGFLYKCPMVAIMPEFCKQYRVTLSEKQKYLLASYKSLAVDCTQEQLEEFCNTEFTAISQCALCPSDQKLDLVSFDPDRKKRYKIFEIQNV